jgi:hypothetical protein
LRLNHPASEDSLELLPNDPATRAEAAYSAAQVLRFSGWEVEGVQILADTFELPTFTAWQKRILATAFARVGMPYVWGGVSDGAQTEFGVPSREVMTAPDSSGASTSSSATRAEAASPRRSGDARPST